MVYASIGEFNAIGIIIALISFIFFLTIIILITSLIFRPKQNRKQLERIEEKLDRLLDDRVGG
ncbi:hypothetical protein ACTWP4_03360 [Gracilibacillus sp. D59]|uniref:hypothetical protein n=1 Tax=Gracilibacillus sp. D59 TaxID=3457434 RepID=UPI003FCD56F5